MVVRKPYLMQTEKLTLKLQRKVPTHLHRCTNNHLFSTGMTASGNGERIWQLILALLP